VGVSRGLGAGGWRERRPGEPWVDGNLGRHLAGTASGTRSPCRARERTALERSDGLGGGEGVLWEQCEGVRLLGVPFYSERGLGQARRGGGIGQSSNEGIRQGVGAR
jgi:hypothetical protein